jgi:prepilin-type N-terminal cleavage/methylation domain-containing protein
MNRGFTLVEVLMAVLLVGLAITALVGANGAFTMVNSAGAELTTSEFLVEQIHGLTDLTEFANLLALNGSTFHPPIDAGHNPLSDLAAFTQQVTVEYIEPNDFGPRHAGHTTTPFLKVTVEVTRGGRTLNSASWIRTEHQ